jgi:hypothetical protein
MNKIKMTVFMVYSLWFMVLLSSCATIPGTSSYKEKQTAPLDVATLLRFSDVPTPAGFKILDAESFAFQNDATRVALLKYAGSKPPDPVVLFYREQMPLYNWSPINIIEYERRILNYENQSESCIVTVESRGTNSIITIAISPKSRPMKVEKKEREEK